MPDIKYTVQIVDGKGKKTFHSTSPILNVIVSATGVDEDLAKVSLLLNFNNVIEGTIVPHGWANLRPVKIQVMTRDRPSLADRSQRKS